METQQDALAALDRAWPHIVDECRAVLGSELHYQAVVYHCLRLRGAVPREQIGMNVKMWIADCVTPLFQNRDQRKNPRYGGGFEPIPDVVLFAPAINGDWRRRNNNQTLLNMLMAIEVKASERSKGRLNQSEIVNDIRKLHAHRDEVRHRGADMLAVIMVIDTAPEPVERMKPSALKSAIVLAQEQGVYFYYVSPAEATVVLPGNETATIGL